MKLLVVADTREKFASKVEGTDYNDHPTRENVRDFIEALCERGYDADYFGGVPELVECAYAKRTLGDAAVLNFSDGLDTPYARVQVPALCEMIGVPCSGSGVFASALLNNKHASCRTVRGAGLLAPRGIRITGTTCVPEGALHSMLPVFVKPNTEGSSVGITSESLQKTEAGALRVAARIVEEHGEALIERYIEGRDITVLIIGNPGDMRCVSAIEILSDSPFLDSRTKSERKSHRVLFDDVAPLADVKHVVELAESAFDVLQCRDIARLDFRLDTEGRFHFIEANSCPRFSRTSEVGFLADKQNLDFADYTSMLVDVFLARVV